MCCSHIDSQLDSRPCKFDVVRDDDERRGHGEPPIPTSPKMGHGEDAGQASSVLQFLIINLGITQ